jgi:YVTN family beta-propeller protein
MEYAVRSPSCFCLIVAFLLVAGCSHDSAPRPDGQTLNTGKDIQPSDATALGGFPVGVTPTPDGKFGIVCGMGYRESLYAISLADASIASKVDFAAIVPKKMKGQTGVDASTGADKSARTNGVYYGIAISGNTVYAAQGAKDSICVLSIDDKGTLSKSASIATKAGDFPAGLAIDDQQHLYVTNNSSADSDTDFTRPASVSIYSTGASATELGRYVFDNPTHTSNFPLGIVALHDGSKTYVGSERDGCVYVLNTIDPTHPSLISSIPTGSHPLGMILSKDQSHLWVANAQSDTLSLIDTKTDQVTGTVLLRPGTSRGLPGVSPTALCLSPDEKTIYVTLADMNAVGVVDVVGLTLKGMIPAGWYPSGVTVTGDNHLIVVNAKGSKFRNPNPKMSVKKASRDAYILNVVQGSVQSLAIPDDKQLADLTDTVIRDNHLDDLAARQNDNPLADIGLKAGKIKHIVYIIKENRTYDQVLGDDARGNGDPSLVLFGKDVTPNEHALADRFVLLDNCYACGEVSGDGWTWSTQSMANDYVEHNIPYNYSGRGRTYDFEGENNGYITGGFPATDPDGKPLSQNPAFKNGAPEIPNVAAMDTHLWDLARDAGLTYRNFGMFLSTKNEDDPTPAMPAFYPTVKGLQPPGHDLAGLTDMDFPNFNLDFPDSDAPSHYLDQTQDQQFKYALTTWGKYNMPSRFAEWNREFQMMLAKDPTGNAVPNLMFVRFPHDHTQGVSSGKHSPSAEVADNDYAVGQLVDAISHSPIWSSTAIFIIEDDAQNGPDHVDAHRTTAFVISPWIKRGSVDHQFCNTDSLLKTMELLLGLPAMSQYDALALPITDWDTVPGNIDPYTATLPAKEIIAQMNPGKSPLTAASDKMNFAHADAAPAGLLNEVIWKSVKGESSNMPAPRNAMASPARRGIRQQTRDDDDD